MRSEIPQIEVITAIGEAELEDYVAQLLFTQGWSIIFRAFDGKSLEEFIRNRSSELRTVIVYTMDLPNLDLETLEGFSSTVVSLICLEDLPHSAHEIMQRIRRQLRIPMVQGNSFSSTSNTSVPRISESKRKIILVTGSSGGPGKTLLATAIASEISSLRRVRFIDADFRSVPLNEYFPTEDFTIYPLTSSEKPKELPDALSDEVTVVDMGVLPPLGEVVNDRRWIALLHNNLFETATQLIYVSQTTKGSLLQLSQFKSEFPLLMQRVSPTYICVGKGASKEVKKARLAFEKLTAGERAFHITEAALLPAPSGVLESLLYSGKKAQKDIGSIATSLL